MDFLPTRRIKEEEVQHVASDVLQTSMVSSDLHQFLGDELLLGTSDLLVVVLFLFLLVLQLLLLLCVLLLLLQLGLLLRSPLLVPQLLQLLVREVRCGERAALMTPPPSTDGSRGRHLTGVGLQLFVVINQRVVVEAQVDLDGCDGGFVVEGVHAEDVLQLQEVHVGAQRHLPHAVGVEIKLVVRDLHKMLTRTSGNGS